MKKFNAIIFAIMLCTLLACGNNENDGDNQVKAAAGITSDETEIETGTAGTYKKYTMESGVITFQRSGVIGNAKVIVYFDDYGSKERKEVYGPDGLVEEITFTDGENMYRISKEAIEEKTAYIMGQGHYGTEMKFVIDPFNNNEKRKAKYEYKKLDNMEVIGKDCEAYSAKASGGVTTFAGWEGLVLYTKVVISMGTMETIAVDLKENADVDSNLFKVPDGYQTVKL